MCEKRDIFWYSVFTFTLLLFLAIVIIGPSIAISTADNDAQLISSISDDLETTGTGESGSYLIMAYIYSVTTDASRKAIVIVVGTIYLWNFFKYIRSHNALLIAVFTIIPPIFLYLSLMQKDITSTLIIIITYFVLFKGNNRIFRISFVLGLYLFYGYTFRPYYMLIAGVFLLIKLFQKIDPGLRVPGVLFLCLLFLLIPDAVLTHLQEPRDVSNEYRIGSGEAGTRTAFMNLLKPDGIYTFVPNYLYAFFRLNIRNIFIPHIQEYFLLLTLVTYAIIVAKGIKYTARPVQDFVILFISHIIILNLFEPDLGSYLRHASTPLLFLAPVLALSDRWDRRNPDRSRLRASLNSRIYRPQAETLQGRQLIRKSG